MTWREALSQGKLSEAKTRYLESDEEMLLGQHFWLDLEALQKYLRAKHWQRAFNILEDFEATEDGETSDVLNREKLMAEIKLLKDSSMLLDRRKPEEALTQLEAVAEPLLQAEKLCQQGTASIFLNETERAKVLFADALELDNKHYRALTNLGNLHLEANEVDNAIIYYEKALAIKDDFANALHNLGVAYRQKGQISKSVGLIRKAQSNLRKADTEDARGELSSAVSGPFKALFGGKRVQYGLYGLAFVVLFFWLRSRGII